MLTFDHTWEVGNNTSTSYDGKTATELPVSEIWTDASHPFIPCRNPQNLMSERTAKMVELVLYGVVYPVWGLTGIVTNLINMAVFARQGLRDRISLCLFRLE